MGQVGVNLSPIPSLITKLCERARFPFMGKYDMPVTPAFSSDNRRIEAEYLKDNAARKEPPSPDATLIVDPKTLEYEDTTPTPFLEQVGIPSSYVLPLATAECANPHSYTCPSLNQELIHLMGSFARSMDVRAARVEKYVFGLLTGLFEHALSPLRDRVSLLPLCNLS